MLENAEFSLFGSFLPLFMYKMHLLGAKRETYIGPTNELLTNNVRKGLRITKNIKL